ncbi:thioredoxin family protein [Streptococcus mutans]|uniref:thioredoxin family protein n=1 Tax=Streptococcus mutans TaxID=1309 RepID=UPI00145500E3|nr:thioredoxin family protein [Streptococcus mutans]NLQ46243.1 thiol reductase thioredoxin [Streptococcus mutans]
MKYYKTLLLCSASLLLLAAGVAYAEEETPQGIEKTEVSASAVTTETQSADATVVQETVAPAATTASTVTSSENKSERSDENSVRETSLETSDQVIENSQPPQQEVDTSSSTEKTSDSKNTVSEGVSVEEYEANVANFKAVSMADVYHMFDDTENSYTLYIGRPTCHYCRDFSPILKEFNGLTGSQLYYYNTDRDDFTIAAKEFLKNKVGIFATPMTLFIDKGQLVSGWVGSGIPSKELYNKLYSNSNLKSGNQTSALKDTPIADKENTTNPTEQVKTVPGSGKPVPRQKSAQSAVSATKKSDSSQMTDEEADKKPVTKVITAFLSFLYDALAKLKI